MESYSKKEKSAISIEEDKVILRESLVSQPQTDIENDPPQRNTSLSILQESTFNLILVSDKQQMNFFRKNMSFHAGGIKSSIVTLFSSTLGSGMLTLPIVYLDTLTQDLRVLWIWAWYSVPGTGCTSLLPNTTTSHGTYKKVWKEIIWEFNILLFGKSIWKVCGSYVSNQSYVRANYLFHLR